MSPNLQVKLLRVLQDRTFEPVGSSKTDLGGRARDRGDQPGPRGGDPRSGRFREDLFYRLNVIPIEVPPLRERREDIPLLVAALPRARQPRPRGRPAPGISERGARRCCAPTTGPATCASSRT